MGNDTSSTEAERLLNLLVADVREMAGKLELHDVLFGDARARAALDEAGHGIFRIFQDVLVDDVLLAVARLTDPAETGRGENAKSNATLRRLVFLVGGVSINEPPDGLESLLKELHARCQGLGAHRNKRLAHSDLRERERMGRACDSPAALFCHQGLPGVSVRDLEEVVSMAARFLSEVAAHLNGKAVDCSPPSDMRAAGIALLKALRSSNEAET